MKWFKGVLCLVLTLVIGFTLTANETQAASKKVSLKLSDGGTYYGEIKEGKPHGKGTARWSENKSFSGDWVNGKRSGAGKYSLTVYLDSTVEKTIYNGQWANDRYNGQGTLYQSQIANDPEEAAWNKIIEINQGSFKQNKFVSGYSIRSSYMGNFFKFEDSNKLIHYHLYYIKDLFKNKLSAEDIRLFEYINKSNKSMATFYKGIEEGLIMTMDIGTYNKKYDIYNGTVERLEEEGYSFKNYSKGKVTTKKSVEYNDLIYGQFEKKMNKEITERLSVLSPHLTTFRNMVKKFNIK